MRHFGQVLVLAEDRGHIEVAVARHPDHIQAEPEIDPLLPLYRHIVRGTIRKTDPLDPVAESRRDVTTIPAQRMAVRRRIQ